MYAHYVKIMDEDVVFSPMDNIGKYTVIKMIGKGGFGDIYGVQDNTSSQMFAMKVESRRCTNSVLDHEIRILKQLQGSPYYPRIFDIGSMDSCKYYVMELLGPSISKRRKKQPLKRFPLSVSIKIGIEMLKCIKQLHRKGYIHRDIKPSNFLIRPDVVYPICLIDFGLAKSYLESESGVHLDKDKNAKFVGTRKYASINALKGISLSRRDDLYSWFFSLIELITGDIPWQNDASEKERLSKLKRNRMSSSVFQHLPSEMYQIYNLISHLSYEETPDYQEIENILNLILSSTNDNPSNPLISELLSPTEISKISSFMTNSIKSLGSLYDTYFSIPSFATVPEEKEKGCLACNIF